AFAGLLGLARAHGRIAPRVPAYLEGARHPGIQRVIGRLEGQEQQARAPVARAAVQGLAGVEEAAVLRVEPGLREAPGRLGPAEEIREAHLRRRPEARPRLEAHPGLRDDPARPLGAEEEPLRRRTGAGAG